MAIYLPRRWRQQPQGPVAINWGNPLARGLYGTIAPINSVFLERSKVRLDGTYNVDRAPIVTPYGLGMPSTGSFFLSQSFGPEDLASFTIAGVAYGRPPNAIDWSIYFQSTYLGLLNNGTVEAAVEQTLNDYVTATTSAGTVVSDRLAVLSAVFKPNAKINLFANGRLAAQSAGNWSGTTRNFSDIYISGGIHTLLLACIWTRALSDPEVVAFSENPWQLFRAPKPIVFSLPGGATIPTLSSPTVINITTTGATPRVTLTF